MLEYVGNIILECLYGNRKTVKGEEIEKDRRYPRSKEYNSELPKSTKSASEMHMSIISDRQRVSSRRWVNENINFI
jgi:hypothetical protein